MASAKEVLIKPISSADANRIIKRLHYSGKVVNNSQVHLGVFLGDRCGGVLQFGPSLDKRKLMGLVRGTKWNEFIELNRMALADWLPRNGESRSIAVCMRLLKRTYPWLKWVVSFADGCQCGDGTIYRASGFVLTGITNRQEIYKFPDGTTSSVVTFKKSKWARLNNGSAGGRRLVESMGAKKVPGYQLRYVYFLDPACRPMLTVPELPFSEIARQGAGMYKGKPRAGGADSGTSADQAGGGGANPTPALLDDSTGRTFAETGRERCVL